MYTYDYFITLDQEIELFWGRRALVSVLFLLNRYLQLYGAVWVGLPNTLPVQTTTV